MAQYDFGVIDPQTKTGTQLAADLNQWRDAVISTHSGNVRPAYAVAGTIWRDTSTTPGKIMVYDGTTDTQLIAADDASFTGDLTIDGNINVTGASRRFRGDMSAAAVAGKYATRALVQSNVTNGLTSLGVIPNGTNRESYLSLWSTQDADSAQPNVHLLVNGTVAAIDSNFAPFQLRYGGTTKATINAAGLDVAANLNFSGVGARITGDFTGGPPYTSRPMFQTNVTNGLTAVGIVPNGTSRDSYLSLWSTQNADGAQANLQFHSAATASEIVAVQSGLNLSSPQGGINFSPAAGFAGTFTPGGAFLLGTGTPLLADQRGILCVRSNLSAQYVMQNSNGNPANFWRLGMENNHDLYITDQSNTGVYMADGTSTWTATSDERTKDIVEHITGASDKLMGVRTVVFQRKKDAGTYREGRRYVGFIAQDWQPILPEIVSEARDETYADLPDLLGMSYADTTVFLAAALKEQIAAVKELTARIAALEAAMQANGAAGDALGNLP